MFFKLLILFSLTNQYCSSFVEVKNGKFFLNNEEYWFLGTNFWYGANLGSKGPGGNRDRLIRELDRLNSYGVKNLRLQAGSEGPDTEPWRIIPSMQPSPGQYNPMVLDGLDFLLHQMSQRNMKAIMCLNNFWHWSGGFAQYIAWANGSQTIPYPYLDGYDEFEQFSAQFYDIPKAVEMFNDHIRFITGRFNNYSNVAYIDDPTIMSWELANEPRRLNLNWVNVTACLLKDLAKKQLVTTGVEGNISSKNFSADHSSPCIDYATFHLWVQNWQIYDPLNASFTLPKARQFAQDYIDFHLKYQEKPIVLEEFGISRDNNSHDPNDPVTDRDEYYEMIFEYAQSKRIPLNFWAYGGEGRPREPFANWTHTDDFIGDPPHEPQGWYSVYNNDSTTINIIKKYALPKNSAISTSVYSIILLSIRFVFLFL